MEGITQSDPGGQWTGIHRRTAQDVGGNQPGENLIYPTRKTHAKCFCRAIQQNLPDRSTGLLFLYILKRSEGNHSGMDGGLQSSQTTRKPE